MLGKNTSAPNNHLTLKELIKFVSKLFLSLVLLFYITKDLDLNELSSTLLTTDIRLFSLALLLNIIGILLFSVSSKYILATLKVFIPIWELTKITLVVGFYSLFLPGGALTGSIIKWHRLSTFTNKKAQSAVYSLFFRLVNLITLLIVALTGLGFSKLVTFPGMEIVTVSILVLLLLVTIGISRPLFIDFSIYIITLIESRMTLLRVLTPKLTKTLTMLGYLQKTPLTTGIGIVVFSLIGHIVQTTAMIFVAQSIGIYSFNFFDMAWIRGIVVVASMLPFALGGLGFKEVGMVAALQMHGYPDPLIISFSLLTFVQLLFKGLLGGLLELHDFLFRKSQRG